MASTADLALKANYRGRRLEIAIIPANGAGQGSRGGDQEGGDEAPLSLLADTKSTRMPSLQFWVLAFGISIGLFLSMLDTSIVATSLYTIGSDLGAMHTINWVALAYTLSYLGCAVAFARLSDVIGRRDAFVIAYFMFFAFSLACGFSHTLLHLIIFRAFQGAGGSGLYSLAMIILPEVCPRKYIQHVGSLIGLVIAAAGVLGPVLGGLLTKHASWRWIFWINAPIGGISIVLFVICWPQSGFLPQTRQRSWKELDFFGSILLIASAVLVIFAFQNAGESGLESWTSIVFVAPLAAGVFCWLVLLFWECVVDKWLRNSVSAAWPISLFRNRLYGAAALSTLFLGFPYLLLIFSFPIRAQVVSGKDALMSGVMLLPMLGATALGSLICGRIKTMASYLPQMMTLGACLMALACGLLMTVSGSGDDTKALGFLSFAGLGFGLSTTAATILATAEASIEDHAPAHGILAQMRVLGGSLGIATSTILIQGWVRRDLGALFSHDLMAALAEGTNELSRQDLDAVRRAYISAFQEGMIIATAVSGAAIFLAMCGFGGGMKKSKIETHTLF